uniref:Uncharacterized protein n=1 Tax=Salix viminalis TaxID=40686 RepID=A0A6N2NAJ3_SALVM
MHVQLHKAAEAQGDPASMAASIIYRNYLNHSCWQDKNRLMARDLRDAKFAWNKLCSAPKFEKLKLHFSLAARGYGIHVFTVPSDRKLHLDSREGNLQV